MNAYDRSSPAHTLVICFAVVCAVAYSTWVVLPRIDPQLPLVGAFVSEYAAAGRPGAPLMRAGDAVAGAFMVAIGVLLAVPGPRWVSLCIRGGLILAGVSTIADAMLAMECTPSLDAVCMAAEKNNTVGLAHQLHLVTSTLVGTGFAVATAASLVMWRGNRLLAGFCIFVLAAIGMTAFNGTFSQPILLGIIQRISLAGTSLWTILLTVYPHPMPPRPMPPHRDTPAGVSGTAARPARETVRETAPASASVDA